MQQGKIEEAKKYFWEALKINREYPNTHFALAMIAQMEDDLDSAFYSTIEAIRLNKTKDVLYQNSLRQAFEIAKKIIQKDQGKAIMNNCLHKLEFQGGTKILMLEDTTIPTAAKIEFAENYDKKNHLIRYKPGYPAVEHLITHELVHLDFVLQARLQDLNLLFVSTQEHKTKFIRSLEPSIKRFHKMGIPEDAIADYSSSLFEGLNRQIFNTPIDLFIENFIYSEFAELRPYQFLSLYYLVQEGIKAMTDKKILELSPKDIVSKSKILNIVAALQFRDLYDIDLIKDFKPFPVEVKQAQSFYDEYLQYKEDREPAEEYELVLHWAEDLKLNNYFELVNEKEFRSKRTDTDKLLESIEKDPWDLKSMDPYKEREMEKFQKSQEALGINMAVVMFMVDALKYFEEMSLVKIKQIAYEIATQGTQGYRPDKKDYRINSIPGKIFSGYHILAYYYVSWMLAIPEMVSQLNLPYDKEYDMALTIYKPGKK